MVECKNNSQFRFRNGSIEQVPEYANHGLFISFPGDYTPQGVDHPEMQTIDRLSDLRVLVMAGVDHPEMQTIDRPQRILQRQQSDVDHPEMQAINVK